jgi:hypothetical protein
MDENSVTWVKIAIPENSSNMMMKIKEWKKSYFLVSTTQWSQTAHAIIESARQERGYI